MAQNDVIAQHDSILLITSHAYFIVFLGDRLASTICSILIRKVWTCLTAFYVAYVKAQSVQQ